MGRKYTTYLVFLVAYFLLISVIQSFRTGDTTSGWFDVVYLPFWVGGILGTLLPDIDHVIYVYALRPHELTSQRVDSLVRSRNYKKSISLLAHTHDERKELIFHNAHFQLIFWFLVVLVVTSGGSLLGLGLVLGFALHLVVDYAHLVVGKGDPNYWFRKLHIELTHAQHRWYLLGNVMLMVLIALYI